LVDTGFAALGLLMLLELLLLELLDGFTMVVKAGRAHTVVETRASNSIRQTTERAMLAVPDAR
jgi:hypothetical protein